MKFFIFAVFLNIIFIFAFIKASEVALPALHQASGINNINEIYKLANKIDHTVLAILKENNLQAPNIIDDATYLRRIFLTLAGRIPTFTEIEHFLNWESNDKRAIVAKALLQSIDYENHKLNWYRDLFRIRTNEHREFVTLMPNFDNWIKNQIRLGTSWRDLSYEILSARGELTNNAKVGFYLANGGDLNTNIGYVFETFLGTNMSCAECHDHPHDAYTRKDFFEVAAFFGGIKTKKPNFKQPHIHTINSLRRGLTLAEQAKAEGRSIDDKPFRKGSTIDNMNKLFFTNVWLGQGTGSIKLPQDYQYSDAKPKSLVQASTPIGFGVNVKYRKTSRASDSLDTFAQWVTDDKNTRFAPNIANRIWQRIMGTSLFSQNNLYENPNDLPYGNLVVLLSDAIKKLNYDTRALEHALVLTNFFQSQNLKKQVFDGQIEMLQGRQLKRMTAEQLWDSLITLHDPYIELSIPKTYEPHNHKLTHAHLGKKLVPLEELYKTLREQQPKIETYADYVSMVKELKSIKNESTEIGYRTLHASEFKLSSQLPSPAYSDHFMSLFGQSDRFEVNALDKSENLSQALALMNGEIQEKLIYNPNSNINKLLSKAENISEKIQLLYLSTYGRLPTELETKQCKKLISSYEDPNDAYPLILGALISSNEFLFIQ